MAEKNSLIEQSKIEWNPVDSDGKPRRATDEELQTGCLQRIALAVEKMARPYADLVQEHEQEKRVKTYYQEEMHKLKKSIPGFRAQVTKLKKKNEALKQEIEQLSKSVE